MAHNEEIVAKFGADTSEIDRAMRGLKERVKDFGKEALGHMGKAFAAGAVIEGIRRTMEMVHALRLEAENLEVSTSFLQGFKELGEHFGPGEEQAVKGLTELTNLVGEVEKGSEEALKKLTKWGLTLKDVYGKDTEQMLYLVADKLHSIESPAQRVAFAFDMMGKSGKQMVGMLSEGSASVKKEIDSAFKLTDEETKAIESMHRQAKQVGGDLLTLIGKIVSAYPLMFKEFSKMNRGENYWENLRNSVRRYEDAVRQAAKMQVEADEKSAEADAKAAAAAKKKLDEQMAPLVKRFNEAQREIELRSKGWSPDEVPFMESKVKQDQEEIESLQKQLEAVGADEVERAKVLADLEQAKLEKLKDEQALRKKLEENQQKEIEGGKALSQEQAKILQDYKELVARKREARGADYMPTIQDVANIGGRYGGLAQQYLFNQVMAKQAFATGNAALGNQLVNANEGYDTTDPTFKVWRRDATGGHLMTVGGAKHHVQGIRETLEKNGVISPEKTMEELNKRMAELVALAGQKGIKLDLPE